MIFDTAAKRLYEKVNVESQELERFWFCAASAVVEVVLADGTSIVKR
jgi:hypothetical protein